MDDSKLLSKIKYRSHNLDCNSWMIQLMIQVYMKHIVSHILYGLSRFLVTFAFYVTMKGQFVSSSEMYFIKKRWIGDPMICQFTFFMACDQLNLLVKFSHEFEDNNGHIWQHEN